MENRNGFSSHPLDMNDDENDNLFSNNKKFYNTNQLQNTSTNIDYKPKVPKRRLPKIPDKSNAINILKAKKTINFYIDIENVKWFYKLDQEQTSSTVVTNTENETDSSNKKWLCFNKLDSCNLEVEYRNIQTKKINNISQQEPNLVQVLENLYKVNLITKKSNAIYWKATTMTVMRSVWFENGDPFEEKSSEEIDKKHIELFKDQITKAVEIDYGINMDTSEPNSAEIDPFKAKIEPISSINIDEGTISWYSIDEIYWEKNKMSVIDKMQIGFSKLRNKINGKRIKRGWKCSKSKEIQNDGDGQFKEITHLIFVVHGIAQKLYENSIVKCCDDIRRECEKKKKEFFPNDDKRFMFLPVDWRSSLILDDGIVESITIKTIAFIRDRLNSSALDIMYYTSALFKTEIMNSLNSELNRLYNLFCQKNKYFQQKRGLVSFIAHSLGSVIVYDILTSYNSYIQLFNTYGEDANQERVLFNHFSHNDALLLNEYLSCKKRIQEIEKQLVKSNNNITSLEFQVENLFCLGSPLAVFLALRGVRPAAVGTQDHILPKNLCKHLFNIFHPSDPVAYRLEPLILKHYSTKSSLEIQKSSDAAALKQSKLSYKELNERRVAIQNVDLKSTLSKNNTTVSKRKEKDKEKDSKSAELEETFSSISASNSFNNYLNQSQIEQVELENALDFQLQESNFELMATVTAHSCYWKSADTGLFITNQLCSN